MTVSRLPAEQPVRRGRRRSSIPRTRWLWRRTPQRLEAELIRDNMLAVSGTLDRTLYGPGTLDEGHTRRSIYFMIKRSKLVPMMQLFDQPEPLVSVGGRPSTTIAPQALAFLNSPHVRGYAHELRQAAAARLREVARRRRHARLPHRHRPRRRRRRSSPPPSPSSPPRNSPTPPAEQARRPRAGPGRLLPGAVWFERVCVCGVRISRRMPLNG